ncbi:hypothetical protein RJ640_025226 [Escallonia rubra]|uniref:Uncharacterized protein n=1 Tax=Escallonia rubra TaxID=112253 RepID=A0AA88RXX6_9ASTE|nr:hypothetical protein RJ640_025226 [Escallonia rubra]
MGDLSTLAKARRELEDLYLGVPDDSVNLTFQDLAEVKQLHAHHSTSLERKRSGQLNPITEATTPKREKPLPPNLAKLPSLDFSRGLEATMNHHHQTNTHYHHHHHGEEEGLHASRGGGGLRDHHHASGRDHHRDHHAVAYSPRRDVGFRHAVETSVAFDDVSGMSMASTVNPFQEKGLWESLLQAMFERWHGRDDRREKVHRVFRKKIQPKVHKKSRKGWVLDRMLYEVSKHSEAARAQVGRKRAEEKWREQIWP